MARPVSRTYTHARRQANLQDVAQRLHAATGFVTPRQTEALLQVTFDIIGDLLLQYGQVTLGDNATISLTRKEDGHAAKYLTKGSKPGPRRAGTYRATIRAGKHWKSKYAQFERGIENGTTEEWPQLLATAWSKLQTRKSKIVRELRADTLIKKWASLVSSEKEKDHGQVRSRDRVGRGRNGKGGGKGMP